MKKIFYLISFLSIFSTIFTKIIIKKEPSSNFEERINSQNKLVKPEYIILHYTANCSESAVIKWFKNSLCPVSTHYVIGPTGTITMMIDPKYQAWHAGESSWKGCEEMNACSIGIEIVNPGSTEQFVCPCKDDNTIWSKKDCHTVLGSKNCWYPFTKQQINSVIQLCKELMKKYNIKEENILGHSDISPGRKIDPGPLFPWSLLAQHSIGLWPKSNKMYTHINIKQAQKYLLRIGYKVEITGIIDTQTQKVLTAFQIHFRPTNIDGKLDLETFSILKNIAHQVKTI